MAIFKVTTQLTERKRAGFVFSKGSALIDALDDVNTLYSSANPTVTTLKGSVSALETAFAGGSVLADVASEVAQCATDRAACDTSACTAALAVAITAATITPTKI